MSYEDRIKAEVRHYDNVFRNTLKQSVPSIWDELEKKFANKICDKLSVYNIYEFIQKWASTNGMLSLDLLSLGSGACGNEINGIYPALKEVNCVLNLTCIDINEKALNNAEIAANDKGLKLNKIISDINNISLEESKYDIIVAIASLHHFVELDHITKEINKALRPNGVFLTVDIPTKNGYMMWDETYEIVSYIWKLLPEKFKIDHTGDIKPFIAKEFKNLNYSSDSFECINSEEILPSLNKNLKCIAYIPAYGFSRRFFDTKFGPNFDINLPLDKSIFEFIYNLDEYYLENNILKPETFFGVYKKLS